MNAIDFILKEHEKIRHDLAEIAKDSHKDETKRNMFKELSQFLVRHETMEEDVWYPKLKIDKELDDIIKHLIAEEQKAAKAIKEFDTIKTQKEWEEKFLKLKHDVEHHASDEEQKLFPKVKKLVDETKLEEIGKQLYAFKQEYTDKHK